PRMESWRLATTAAPATLVRAHHAVVIAQDGSNVWGFSIWDDRWTSVALQGSWSAGGGQVESGWASDGSRVYGYGGVGQASAITEFPDFYRVSTQGSLFRVEVTGEPGSPMLLGVSLAGASIPTPYGLLLIDPASMLLVADTPIPAGGVF